MQWGQELEEQILGGAVDTEAIGEKLEGRVGAAATIYFLALV